MGGRRTADQDRDGDGDPEVQPAAAAALRHADRGDHGPATPLGTGHPGGGAVGFLLCCVREEAAITGLWVQVPTVTGKKLW